jgi:hypothetical protein
MAASRKLKPTDVLRFLAAKKAGAKCVCGSTQFDIVNEATHNGRAGIFVFKFPGHEVAGSQVMDVVLLACVNCGTIRQLQRKLVIDWVAKHPTH